MTARPSSVDVAGQTVAQPAAALPCQALAQPGSPARMSRRLWVVYPLALLAVNSVWSGVMQVLLGKQIAAVVPDPAASAAALGLALGVAALSSVVSQPIVGRLSDRTRTRFLGRRNVWIFGAGVVSALGLAGMSQLTSTAAIAVAWAVLMWPLNATQAALMAVLPERVPERIRGSISGLAGAAGLGGGFLGVALAGLSREVFMGYLLIAALYLLLTQIFAFTTTDHPARGPRDAAESRAVRRFPTFRTAPDYWWAFIGRFLMIFGYFTVMSFQLYILRDYVGVGDVDAAGRVLVGVAGLSAGLSLLFALVGGWLSDKAGRLLPFVAVSSLMFVPAGVVWLLVPTMTGAWVASAIIGAAFGIYIAVDQALISRVLPNVDDSGRDLGIMNIANAGPQVIAPSLAGAVVGATGSYQIVFVLLIVSTALGALSVRSIKGVR